MKQDFDLEQALKNGQTGERLRQVADSEEGRRLSQTMDLKAVEAAARAGDGDALKNILAQVLATPDGRALAKKVTEAMQGK